MLDMLLDPLEFRDYMGTNHIEAHLCRYSEHLNSTFCKPGGTRTTFAKCGYHSDDISELNGALSAAERLLSKFHR
jgi:hypothetical protein